MVFIYNVGLGELLDRLSIVCRKLVERELVSNAPAEAFIAEAHAIVAEVVTLHSGMVALMAAWSATTDGFMLAATNAALWERENELRRSIAAGWSSTSQGLAAEAQLGCDIAALNDRRRALIATLSGVNADPKIYRS